MSRLHVEALALLRRPDCGTLVHGLCAAVCATLWLALAGFQDSTQPARGPLPAELDRMAERCVAQMVSNTCRAAQDTRPVLLAGAVSAVTAPVIFVAGIGAIDAQAYDELRRHGQALCSQALAACRRDPAAPACVLAVQLWGTP